MTRVFHYTVAAYLPSILEDRMIRPADAYITPGERAAVWFSTQEWWEPTANKNYRRPDGALVFLNKEETQAMYGGLIRIEVEPEAAPYTWQDFKRMAGTPRKILRALEKTAAKSGSRVATWRISFEPVRAERWIEAEVWQDRQWVPMLHAAGCPRCDRAGLVKSLVNTGEEEHSQMEHLR